MGWVLITPRDSFPGFFPALMTWISPPWLGGVEGARIYPSGGNPAPTGGIFLPKIPRGAALEQSQPIPSLWIGKGWDQEVFHPIQHPGMPGAAFSSVPSIPLGADWFGCSPAASASFGSHNLWKTTWIWEL